MKTSRKKQQIQKQGKLMFGILLCIVIIFLGGIYLLTNRTKKEPKTEKQVAKENTMQTSSNQINEEDWRLKLANRENTIEEDYEIPLAKIEGQLYFDKRALPALNELRNAAIKAGYSNLWIQSSYRSIELQKKLFSDKVNQYIKKGKGKQEAENLAMQVVNRPGQSDHNLGLAVDFNYVNDDFKNLNI
ncbi:MAG: D-alanyl-D-alanine carboxypeptidase family protein [Clostridia bacterium]